MSALLVRIFILLDRQPPPKSHLKEVSLTGGGAGGSRLAEDGEGLEARGSKPYDLAPDGRLCKTKR